jgi:hypothetical protein
VTQVTLDVFGAAGAPGSSGSAFGPGGLGGRATVTVAVSPGQTFQINVGGAGSGATGGFNGGGNGAVFGVFFSGGGGGASDVRAGGFALADRVVVAGGGAGGGDTRSTLNGGTQLSFGGGGGGLTGGDGGGTGTFPSPGTGGTQVIGGTGGDVAGDGVFGAGGAGACDGTTCGGGGGAGWWGGGGGEHGGGGGGSGFGPAGVVFQSGVRSGNGEVTVTYTTPSAVTFASARAARTSKGVLVRWRSGTEVDLLGFQVYRSRGHSWRRISHSLIAAKGSVSGASYRFLDRTARRGVSYRYRIKAVNRDGTTSWFGPVRVT